jgi:hypothetical protein
MPPSNTTGKDNGKAPRNKMAGQSRSGILASRGMLRLAAMTCTTTIISTAISKPGTSPPRNSAPTEAPDTRA